MNAWPPPQLAASRPVVRHRAQISRVPYLAGLDGLRAVAVVAVMLYHADHRWLSGGFLGVEVFFVISGYLITLLLIGEHERTGRVSLRQFWKRRAKRLLPALAVVLAGVAVYMALFQQNPQGQTRGDFIGGLSYVSNWYQLFVGQGYTATEAFAPLRHLWSLAVEEQFYLLWPLIMILLLRRGHDRLPRIGLWLAGVSVAIAVAVGALFVNGDIAATCSSSDMHGYWRIAGRCININETLYLSTFARAAGLMLGAALAMFWRPVAVMRGRVSRHGHWLDVFALLGLGGLVLLMWHTHLTDAARNLLIGDRFDPWLFRGGFLLTGIATIVVIAAATHRRTWFGKILGNPLFRWIGTRSYGLYLFHWPIYQIIRQQAGVALTRSQFIIAMVATVLVTETSYRLVEMPVRRGRFGEWLRGERRVHSTVVYVKRRTMAAASAVAVGLVGFAGVSIATADNKCVGDVSCSLQAARIAAAHTLPPIVATTTTSTTPTSTTTTTTIAATTTTAVAPLTSGGDAVASPPVVSGVSTTPPPITGPPTPVPPTPVPPTTVPPTTVPPTTHAGPTTTLAPFTDLHPVAIGESVMAGAVNELTAAGFYVDARESRQGPEVADVLGLLRAVDQLGQVVVIQSGTNGPVSDATYARMMSAVPANLTALVVFLTVRADGRGYIDANNAKINALPAKYPNVRVLDWTTLSNGAHLCGDSVHIACGGGAAQYYTNLILDAVGRPELKR